MSRLSSASLLLLIAGCQSTVEPAAAPGDAATSLLAEMPWAEHLGGLETVRETVDELGFTHVRVQQTVSGIPVFGGEAIVHLRPDGRLRGVTDNRVADVKVDPRASLTETDAIFRAIDSAGLSEDTLTAAPTAVLNVLRRDGQDRLVWVVQLEQIDAQHAPTRPQVFVDAHDGSVVWTIEALRTAEGRSNYSGTVQLDTYNDGTIYYMEDTGRDIGTYSFGYGESNLYYLTDNDDVWSDDPTAVDVHYGAAATWDYFWEAFGRQGPDGQGGPRYIDSRDGGEAVVSMLVHYSRNYNNAFYSGEVFVFGDGDGSQFGALTSLDVVAHEMSHAVNGSSAGFTYYGESGALDEGFADIFAAMVERDAYGESARMWTIGEDCYTPSVSGDALRYITSPTRNGYSPDHYSSRYTGPEDNAGVHVNSGIVSLAFYLHAEGGGHPTSGDPLQVDGISSDTAAEIWYRALTHYMTASTDFAGARVAVLLAAADLYGSDSDEYAAAQDAWYLVGVGPAAPERDSSDDNPDDGGGDNPDDGGGDNPDDGGGIGDTGGADDGSPDDGGGDDGGVEEPAGPCDGYDSRYEGSLSGLQDFAVEPEGGSYRVIRGLHRGCVSTSPDADVMMVLMFRRYNRWRVASIAETVDGVAELEASLPGGEMTWLVASEDAGDGLSYTFGLSTPRGFRQ